MNTQQDEALHLMYQATASSLRAMAERIDDTAGLLVPPGKRDWSGSSSSAFGHSVHAVHRQVALAADLAAAAGRFATDADAARGKG
ncbi:MAG TPA: hypothetical protein VGM94_19050 [Galbitalea sp.]